MARVTLPQVPDGMTADRLVEWLRQQLLPSIQRVLEELDTENQTVDLLYRPKAITVASLPTGSNVAVGSQVYVTDESGGAQGASFDGSDWRRFSDRAVVS